MGIDDRCRRVKQGGVGLGGQPQSAQAAWRSSRRTLKGRAPLPMYCCCTVVIPTGTVGAS